ncbi:unnamed protein product, partial [marine sediment metagenome]
MLEKIRTFYRRHSRKFTGFLIAIIVIAWLLGPPFAQYLPLEISIGVSLTIIIVMLGLIIDYLADIKKPSIQILPNQRGITLD